MRPAIALLLLPLCLGAVLSARADDTPQAAPLQRTDAFEQAYSASFYQFDACGDGLAGRSFRIALTQKVLHCPFTPEAKKRFQQTTIFLRRHGSESMAKLIDANGGLPVRLEGMTRTCREQRDSPEYRELRERLDAFASGRLESSAVVTAPCDATTVTP